MVNFDWEIAFEGLNSQEANNLFNQKISELTELHVSRKQADGRSAWLGKPPRAMLREKSSAWGRYKAIRQVHGRNGELARNALMDFNRVILLYKSAKAG